MGSRGMGLLLGNDNTQFRRARETPVCATALGPSFGSSTWLMCQSDFAVMQKGAIMAVSSPRLVSMALGEKVSAEDLGGWRLDGGNLTFPVGSIITNGQRIIIAQDRTAFRQLPAHARNVFLRPSSRRGLAGALSRDL